MADLHHLPQVGVLHPGSRGDHSLRHTPHAGLQTLPFPPRKCSKSSSRQISHEIYKRIQKHLEKVKLEEYNSHFGLILSFICTHSVALLLKITKKIAAYIDSQHIEEVEKHILDIIKILEYKKSAINMRHQAAASEVNKELNTSEFNNSVEEEPVDQPVKKIIRSEIGNQMSKILADFDNDDPDEQVRMKGTSHSIQLSR